MNLTALRIGWLFALWLGFNGFLLTGANHMLDGRECR